LITQELWDACEQATVKRTIHRQSNEKFRPYLLRGLVYRQNCTTNITDDVNFRTRGKMYGQTQREAFSYY
jgi:hypothetical protein